MDNGIIDIAKLVEGPKEEYVEIPGKEGRVKVRALSLGDISDVFSTAKDDVFKQTFAIIIKGVVEPKLTWEDVKKLSPETIKVLSEKINELSGFSSDLVKEAKKPLGLRGAR